MDSRPRKKPALDSDGVRGHYDAKARQQASVTADDRKDARTLPLRLLNNFVKACFIDCAAHFLAATSENSDAAAALIVCDVACGRGQDVAKWKHAAANHGMHIASFHGCDLSAADVEFTRAMAAKFLPRATAQVHVCDLTAPWETNVDVPRERGADVLSCQLALHYLCGSGATLAHFFAEAAARVRTGGLVLVSFADGRSVVRRARDALGGGAPGTAADASGVVSVVGKYFSVAVPTTHLRAGLPSPFGCEYTFTLPGCVDGVPEFLCHEGCVEAAARAAGFRTLDSQYFDDAALGFLTHADFRAIGALMGGTGIDDPHARSTANLYRAVVFVKCADDAAALKRAIRAWESARLR